MTTGPIYNAATELIDRHIAEGRAALPAFIDAAGPFTYGDLADMTGRMANLLTAVGLRREARVAVLLLDTRDFPIAFWGTIKAGIVPVALNTLLTAEQYAYILSDSRAEALVVSAPLLATIEPILPRLPALRHVFVSGGGPHAPADDLAAALARQPAAFECAATSPDETAFWLYSSGSTGNPKGVRHVHTSLVETARLYGQAILGLAADDLVFSAAKLFFAYGLGNAMTFPLSVGATAVLLAERPTPDSVFRVLAEHRPTVFFGVPTLYAAMLAHPGADAAMASSRLRVCVSAGEALPAEVGLAWKRRFGVDILDGVGSTEMLHIYVSNRPGDIQYGSSGKPVPGYRVRLVDERGADVVPGDVGEMLVSGPTVAEGYWNQRDKSRRTFAGEWMHTGDKYVCDRSGCYTYQGRTDDMFKVSGIWVSPFEVESALVSHPAVLEAAVVAKEDGDGLTKPRAVVVLKPGQSAAGLVPELQDHVKATAGPWKYPRWIEFTDALPKTATGKIQRFKLRQG